MQDTSLWSEGNSGAGRYMSSLGCTDEDNMNMKFFESLLLKVIDIDGHQIKQAEVMGVPGSGSVTLVFRVLHK